MRSVIRNVVLAISFLACAAPALAAQDENKIVISGGQLVCQHLEALTRVLRVSASGDSEGSDAIIAKAIASGEYHKYPGPMTVRIEQEQKTGLKMPNGATIRLSCVATVTTAEDCNWMVRFVESD